MPLAHVFRRLKLATMMLLFRLKKALKGLKNAMLEKTMRPIRGNEDLDLVNKAIRVPASLISMDGRRFAVREWQPHVEAGGIVTVMAEFVVEMHVKDEDMP